MKTEFGSIILTTIFRYIMPFLLVYSVYLLFHGEYSPGGAFQAGGLLGIVIVLDNMLEGKKAIFHAQVKYAVIWAGIGTFIFIFVGILSMFNFGNFLEYSALPLPVSGTMLHTIGITGIEIGVTICVAATIVAIFAALQRGRRDS